MNKISHIQSNSKKAYALGPASRRLTFSSSSFIVLSFSLSAPCRVVIVSTSLFIRSMFGSAFSSDSNIGPLSRNNHSAEISVNAFNVSFITLAEGSVSFWNIEPKTDGFMPILKQNCLSDNLK